VTAGEIRPSAGKLIHVDGTETELRFVPTGCKHTFLAVTVDGDRVPFRRGDRVEIDRLGPRQSVILADRVEP
jgi:hypothetical protein